MTTHEPPPLPSGLGQDGWFLEENGEEAGPFTWTEIASRFKQGRANPSTLAWREGMDDWTPCGEIAALESILWVPSGGWLPGPKPWRRFWARSVDFMLASLLAAFGTTALRASPGPEAEAVIFFLLIFGSMLAEAGFLAALGATPGKWLFRTVVTDSAGRRPTFGRALSRTVLVWVRGLAMRIPILTQITQLWAYRKLWLLGETTWDRDLDTAVHHRPTGPLPWAAAMVMLGLYFILSFAVVWPDVQKRLEEDRARRLPTPSASIVEQPPPNSDLPQPQARLTPPAALSTSTDVVD